MRTYTVDGKTKELNVKFYATRCDKKLPPKFIDDDKVFKLNEAPIDLGKPTPGKTKLSHGLHFSQILIENAIPNPHQRFYVQKSFFQQFDITRTL